MIGFCNIQAETRKFEKEGLNKYDFLILKCDVEYFNIEASKH